MWTFNRIAIYFYRKQRYRDNRRRQEKIAIVSKLLKENPPNHQQPHRAETEIKGETIIKEESGNITPVEIYEEGDKTSLDDMVVERPKSYAGK